MARLASDARLPHLVMAAELARLTLRSHIQPPRTTNPVPPSGVVLEAAPPRLESSAAGGWKIVDAISERQPKTPIPPAPVAPVAGPHAAIEKFSSVPGEAADEQAAIVSIPDIAVPLADQVVVPAGSGSPESVASAGGGGSSPGANKSQAGGASLKHLDAGTAGIANPTALSNQRPVADTPSSAPFQIVRPREGHYDVMVTQSGTMLSEAAELIKGRPVYSVYLSVGERKDWILQYCLPDGTTQVADRGPVIDLGVAARVDPPYAFVMHRPGMRFKPSAQYAFFHGFVNAKGRFEKLAEAGVPALEATAEIIAALKQWEFRPAMQEGRPIAVEVLLCIPNISI